MNHERQLSALRMLRTRAAEATGFPEWQEVQLDWLDFLVGLAEAEAAASSAGAWSSAAEAMADEAFRRYEAKFDEWTYK